MCRTLFALECEHRETVDGWLSLWVRDAVLPAAANTPGWPAYWAGQRVLCALDTLSILQCPGQAGARMALPQPGQPLEALLQWLLIQTWVDWRRDLWLKNLAFAVATKLPFYGLV